MGEVRITHFRSEMRPATLDIILTFILVLAVIGAAYLGLKATHKRR